MPCPERHKLLELYLETARARNEAVRAMIGCESEVLERLAKLAESARQAYNDCREVLEAHERSHGCGPKP